MPGGIHPPIEVMLSWPVPNYKNPVTRPMVGTVLGSIMGPITMFLVFARLWVRIYMQRSPDWDDWAMLAALPFIIALTVMLPLCSDRYQFNRHVWDVEPHNFVIQRKFILAIETVFCIGAGLIKVSILLFYRRLSSRGISKAFKWTTWITIGFITAYSVAFSLVPIFGCRPISAFWDQSNIVKKFDPNYKYTCFNEAADVVTANAISTAQDLLTAVLPTFIYWNLKIPLRQKIALGIIFAIAYGVVALGTMRLYYTWKIFYGTYDVTWIGWELWIWTLLEIHVGAMCANAPALKAFFKRYFKVPTTFHSSSNKSGTARSGSSNLFFWKASHTEKGYLSESSQAKTTVDEHGGVRIKKEVSISQTRDKADAASRELQMIDGLEMDILRGGDSPKTTSGGFLSPLPSNRTSSDETIEALPSMPSRFQSFTSRLSQPKKDSSATPSPSPATRSPPPPRTPETPKMALFPATHKHNRY